MTMDNGSARPNGPRLWRSLEELADTPEARRFIEAEFPYINETRTDRRTILRLMGASLALAGLSACEDAAAPFFSKARGRWTDTLGPASSFASVLELDGDGMGVLVETRNGRPIKIDGNPLHPASLGATDVFAQAELLSFYDPDRSRVPLHHGDALDWASALKVLTDARASFAGGGEGVRLLIGPVASPTLRTLIAAMLRENPAARAHQYAPVANDALHNGAMLAFGRPIETVHDFSQADAILTLGADPFGDMAGHVRHAREFAERRRAALDSGRAAPKLYAAETSYSLTGARADRRVALRPADIASFARAVAFRLGAVADGPSENHPLAETVADDLRRAGARSLVVVGREQPAAVHALAHAINADLGASGSTLRHIEPLSISDAGHMDSLTSLAQDIEAGAVSHLFILGGNPAYDAPADLDFAKLIPRVPVSIHLGTHQDETAAAAKWHLPRKHALEDWGDARAFDGTAAIRQPVAMPLVDALGDGEALALFLGGNTHDGHDIVRAYWRDALGSAGFESTWQSILADGVVPNSTSPTLDVPLLSDWDRLSPAESQSGLSVVFAPDSSVWDGRHANNGWLQELPRPMTKIVWDNAAMIAPTTAVALGLKTGDVVTLTAGERSLRAPVRLTPGHAPDTVTLPLGYGRRAAGRIGTGVGFDVNALRSAGSPWIETDVEIVRTGDKYVFVETQDHHAMTGEGIVRVVAPGAAVEHPATERAPSFYPAVVYDGHAWGMTIDLDACLGCNACVVSCQAENNIPIVGREEVALGREMHWLRVDRYYAGEIDNPDAYFQPVPCMHCEKAPCEVVCPVNATVHSSEGLNEMVYNRCIGTRTCSNNCPYKVRRFNWFEYSPPDPEPRNPDVSIRPRGVMEKCTYCVQRISRARIDADLEGRQVGPELMTACQQACPTRAITFGDINDPSSAVSRLKDDPRNYALLGELDTRPRTTYLARVAGEKTGDG